jgi:hypothetical protein
MSPGPLHPVGFWAAAGGGDTINLTATDAFADGSGGPITCEIVCYRANHGTRAGEVWYDDNGLIYGYDIVTPVANSGDYQMRWDDLSGTGPYLSGSSAESTWIAIDTTDFFVAWRLGSGPGDLLGSVTVSIRKGTGATLATAVWAGELSLSGKGK